MSRESSLVVDITISVGLRVVPRMSTMVSGGSLILEGGTVLSKSHVLRLSGGSINLFFT